MLGDRTPPGLRATLLALPLVLLAALSVACGGDALPWADGDAVYGDGTWHGTMDTLEDGAVVVRNPEQGIWTEEQAWRIEEELRIGTATGEGPEVFGRITAVAVDSLGRIWVADGRAHEIRIFDRQGRHVRSFGREGEGPGEFADIAALLVVGDRRIVSVDLANNRYSVFDTTGTFLRDHPRPGFPLAANPWRGALTASGHLVDAGDFTRPDGIPSSLVVLDSLFRTRRTVPFPRYRAGDEHYGPELVWRVGPTETLWFGTANRYRIYARRVGGDTIRIVERAVEPEPRSEEEIASEVSRVNQRIHALTDGDGGGVTAEDFAEVEPLYRSFWLDDAGRLWVARGGYDDPPVREIDVFGPQGRYLGPVRSDVGLRPRQAAPALRGQRIWAVTEDTLDVEYVVRGRIVR